MFHEEQYLGKVVITKEKRKMIFVFIRFAFLLHNRQDQAFQKIQNENEYPVQLHSHEDVQV
jgi:hypothetical protein